MINFSFIKTLTINLFIFLFTSLILFHIIKFVYIKKFENVVIHDKKLINFYIEYANKLNHLRSPYYNISSKKNIKKEDFLYTNIYSSKKNKTILIQGDSRTEGLSGDRSDEIFNLKKFKDTEYNIINAGISSYSISPMNVQFNVLKNDFDINPDIVVALIDPTDIADEICRYKSLLVFKDYKLDAVKKSLKGSVYEVDTIINRSLLKTNNLFNLETSLLFIKLNFERYFKKQKKKCTFDTIQKYLINLKENDLNYFKYQIVNYIQMLENNDVKKLFIVTYPHIQHIYPFVFKKKYNIKISDIINQVLIENDFNILVNHINHYNEDIFGVTPENYNTFFVEGDRGSHLTSVGNKIFLNDILNKVYENK